MGDDDRGHVTPAFVAVTGLTLVLLVLVAQVLLIHHARGVLQSAVEEGARQGVAAGVPACQLRATSVIDRLGALGDGVGPVTCAVGPDGAEVAVSATFTGWLPGFPVQQVDVVGRAATRPAGVGQP